MARDELEGALKANRQIQAIADALREKEDPRAFGGGGGMMAADTDTTSTRFSVASIVAGMITPALATAATPDTTPPLWLCVHEVGHAIAQFVLDELSPYPGPFIRSITVNPSDDYLGCVKTQPRVMMIPEYLAAVDRVLTPQMRRCQRLSATYDVVECLAGYVAELYQKGGPYSPLMRGDRLCERTVAGDLDADDDMRKARETIEWLDPADRAEERKRLWDITYSLVAPEWPGIVGIARILQARRFMEGDAFVTEWRSVRSTDAVWRRLEARVGQEIGWRDRLAPSGAPR
jgi:hypothetical protein